jgi:hypothetical protein
MSTRTLITVALALLLLGGGALGVKAAVDSRRPTGSDEDQIRRMLYDGERAAERRDGAALNAMISENYRDSLGMSDSSLKYQIREFLRRNQVIEITVPSESIRVSVDPGAKSASVSFRVSARAGRRGGGPANSFEMSLQLVKEPVYYYWLFPGEEWRVAAAEGYTGFEGYSGL